MAFPMLSRYSFAVISMKKSLAGLRFKLMNIQLRRVLNSYHNNFSRPSGNNSPNCPWPLRLFKWQELWVTLQQSLQINRIKVWASIRLGQFQQQMENAFSGLKNDNSLKSVHSISSTTLNVFNTKRID